MWTKARDRLPSSNGHYLVFNGSDIEIAWYQHRDVQTIIRPRAFYDEFNQQLDITHWMPMPVPPSRNIEVKEYERNV